MSEQTFYRLEVEFFGGIDEETYSKSLPTPKLSWKTFCVLKETEKGYWIAYVWDLSGAYKKWVSKTSRKRFAYPTKAEALENYIKRTESRIKILEAQKFSAECGLKLAKQYDIEADAISVVCN